MLVYQRASRVYLKMIEHIVTIVDNEGFTIKQNALQIEHISRHFSDYSNINTWYLNILETPNCGSCRHWD